MSMYKRTEEFFIKKAKSWYVFIALFIILVIMNYGFLRLVLSLWACNIIALFLVCIVTMYIAIMSKYLIDEYKKNVEERKKELYLNLKKMQMHIDELYERNCELENEIKDILISNSNENTHKTIGEVTSVKEKVLDRIQEFDLKNESYVKKQVLELHDSIRNSKEQQQELSNKNLNRLNEIDSAMSNKVSELNRIFSDSKTDIDNQVGEQNTLIRQLIQNIKNQIEDMYLSDVKATEKVSDSISLLNKDLVSYNENILETIEKNTEKIENVIEVKTQKYDADNEENIKILDDISVLIKSNWEENREIIGNTTDRIISRVKEGYEAEERLIKQNMTNQDKVNKNIEEQINFMVHAIEENGSVIKEIINEDVEHIVIEMNKCRDVLDEKLSEKTINDNNSYRDILLSINTAESNLMLDGKENSGEIKELIKKQNEHNNQEINNIKQKFDNSVDIFKEESDRQLEMIDLLKINILDSTEIIKNNINSLGKKISETQKEVSNLVIRVLEEQSELNKNGVKDYNNIINHIENMSREADRQTEELKKCIRDNNELINSNNCDLKEIDSKHVSKLRDLYDVLDGNMSCVKNNQSFINEKFEGIEKQLQNLNDVRVILNNIVTIQKQFQEKKVLDNKNKQIDPNRIEEIKDDDSNILLKNHYKNNKLASSEMYEGNKKSYDVEYDLLGRIVRTRNYGKKGEITTELKFYPNGQVKTRIENIYTNGKKQMVTTEFDEQGNKIK